MNSRPSDTSTTPGASAHTFGARLKPVNIDPKGRASLNLEAWPSSSRIGREQVMAGKGKWQIEGWGAAQGQIREAIGFLCDGKPAATRAEIADELVALVRALARGDYPKPQASPFDRDEYERESWARASARHIIGGALSMSERFCGAPRAADQDSLLREIAKGALWHMPNSRDEVRKLVSWLDMENLRQPHPLDDKPSEG